jgi:hypothetical protein
MLGTSMAKRDTTSPRSHDCRRRKVERDPYVLESISILPTAKMLGNRLAPRVSIADCANFNGKVAMSTAAKAARSIVGRQAATALGERAVDQVLTVGVKVQRAEAAALQSPTSSVALTSRFAAGQHWMAIVVGDATSRASNGGNPTPTRRRGLSSQLPLLHRTVLRMVDSEQNSRLITRRARKRLLTAVNSGLLRRRCRFVSIAKSGDTANSILKSGAGSVLVLRTDLNGFGSIQWVAGPTADVV